MAGRRERGGAMGSPEGGPTKVGCKGKNFIRVEEEQLCRSVMLVSQDRVVGNQQKEGVFWERITVAHLSLWDARNIKSTRGTPE